MRADVLVPEKWVSMQRASFHFLRIGAKQATSDRVMSDGLMPPSNCSVSLMSFPFSSVR